MTTAEHLPPLTRLRDARERFLAGGPVPEGLPEDVVSAWRRARFHGVRHDATGGEPQPAGAGPLLAAARPVLDRLAPALDGRSALILTDNRLRVLWSAGDHHAPYADLSEERVGPNSAALALRTDRRAEVHGPEHFLDDWQDVSAVSTPVHAPGTTRPTGTVTVATRLREGCAAHPCGTCLSEADPPALHPPAPHPSAALTEAAAAAIEAELVARSTTPERLLLDAYLAARTGAHAAPHSATRTGDRPVAAFGGHSRLVDDTAARALTPEDLQHLERTALRDPEARRLTVAGRRVDLTPVRQGETTVGVVAVLGPLPAQHVPAPCRTQPPLLITGERGTGKTALARELAPGIKAVDAAEGELGDALAELTDGHPLLLRHAERLAPSDTAALNSLLDTHPAAPLYVTYTPGPPPGPCLQRLLDVLAARSVTLPALRERPADIAELVKEVAPKPPPGQPPLTWSLDALRALERHPWPGNLTELAHVVHALAHERRLTGPVRRAELPDAVREGPAHRPLSPMEDAERTAILQALERHGGNKARAASALGIGRATLYRKLRSYRL
ncbi:helix-turn-helix domain-containing protein [Streptomyces sp. NPDC004539]|uniref:helix-turn-helix domain-containing protein n=1 Tax=Streptomyces sp. NPDC004539 TaxID=3154280 RepID=UPI0033B0D464